MLRKVIKFPFVMINFVFVNRSTPVLSSYRKKRHGKRTENCTCPASRKNRHGKCHGKYDLRSVMEKRHGKQHLRSVTEKLSRKASRKNMIYAASWKSVTESGTCDASRNKPSRHNYRVSTVNLWTLLCMFLHSSK